MLAGDGAECHGGKWTGEAKAAHTVEARRQEIGKARDLGQGVTYEDMSPVTNFLQLGPTSYSFHPLREVLLIVNVSMNELIGEMGAFSLPPFPSLPSFLSLFFFLFVGQSL